MGNPAHRGPRLLAIPNRSIQLTDRFPIRRDDIHVSHRIVGLFGGRRVGVIPNDLLRALSNLGDMPDT